MENKDNNHFIRASYLRAVAGRYRDQCQGAWGNVDKNDWQVIETLLTKTYWELSQGIIINKK